MWAVFWAIASVMYEDVAPTLRTTTDVTQLREFPTTPQAPQSSSQAESAIQETETNAASGYQSRAETMHGKSKNTPTVQESIARMDASSPARTTIFHRFPMTRQQLGVTVTMCWFAMTCFFILGAWEANIPVFTSFDSLMNPFHFSPFAAGNLIALGGVCTFPLLFANLFIARRIQDRHTLVLGTTFGLAGLLIALGILATRTVTYGRLFACWFFIALGFNIISTIVLSLLSKQLPGEWNGRLSLAIQYSMFTGRVTGAVWGGAGAKVGMLNFVGLQIALVGVGAVLFSTLWRDLKAKTG